MSLTMLYAPTEITQVLGLTRSETHKKYEAGLLCNAVTDVVSDENAESGARTIATLIGEMEVSDKSGLPMIFPLIEKQKILGLFTRNHWVTLHYDPKTQTATLIDSRPWLISFLYPKTAMKQSLEAAGLVVDKWRTIYQGVQYNDIHCGAWTCSNALALATGFATLDDLQNRFSVIDEQSIVQHNVELFAEQDAIRDENDIYISKPKSLLLSVGLIINSILKSFAGAAVAVGKKLGLVKKEPIQTEEVPDCDFDKSSQHFSDHSSTAAIRISLPTPVVEQEDTTQAEEAVPNSSSHSSAAFFDCRSTDSKNPSFHSQDLESNVEQDENVRLERNKTS